MRKMIVVAMRGLLKFLALLVLYIAGGAFVALLCSAEVGRHRAG